MGVQASLATKSAASSHTERGHALTVDETEERLVKSTERVKDLGEVFTPSKTVEEMLALLPRKIWEPHPSATFLEPSCGDGNFLVAIMNRKLARVVSLWEKGKLPAGADEDALFFHLLEAASSVYGVDISVENIDGGVPEHPIGARTRMLDRITHWVQVARPEVPVALDLVRAAEWIINRNVQVGNMLPFSSDGQASGREKLPLVQYSWDPSTFTVDVATTTLGDVMAEAEQETSDVLSLFGPTPPTRVWSGSPLLIFEAPVPQPGAKANGRNGRRSK